MNVLTFEVPKQKLVSLIKAGLIGALFIAPLAFYPYSPYPLVSPKVAVFQIFVEIVFALWLTLAVADKKYRPRLTPVTVLLSIFLAIAAITSIIGIDIHTSLWGSADRKTGLIALAHFYAFFLVFSSLYRDIRFSFFIKTVVAGGGILSLVAIIQRFSWIYYPSLLGGTTERPGGIVSNAPFLAGYLIFAIFFSIYLAYSSHTTRDKSPHLPAESNNPREGSENSLHSHDKTAGYSVRWGDKIVFWSAAAFFASVIIFITQTRGAIVGLLLGVMLLILLDWDNENLKNLAQSLRARKKFLVSVLLIAVTGASIVAGTFPFWEKIPGINRFASFTESFYTRLALWEIGLEGARELPFTGWGIESFEIMFHQFYDPRSYTAETSYIFRDPDRPFNIIVEWLAASGIFGLLSYIGIFAAALYSIFRTNFRRKSIFIALLAAYFIQNMVLFDTIATYPVFFFFLAFIDKGYKDSIPDNGASESAEGEKGLNVIFAAIMLIVGIATAYYLNANTVRAEYLAYRANYAIQNRADADTGSRYYKLALDVRSPYHGEIASNFARDIKIGYTRSIISKDWESHFGSAASALEAAAFRSPRNFQYKLGLAKLYNTYAPKNAGFAAKAAPAEKSALALAPGDFRIYLEIAKTKLLEEDRSGALLNLSYASDLNPDLENPLVTLAEFYYEIGNYEKSGAEIDLALKQGLMPKYANAYVTFGETKAHLGDFQSAILFYSNALNATWSDYSELPQSELLVNTELNLALSYYSIGDKENAVKILNSLEDELRERSEPYSYETLKVVRDAFN